MLACRQAHPVPVLRFPRTGGTSILGMDVTMRKPQISFLLVGFLSGFFLLCARTSSVALDRQPNSDYHSRREELSKKVGDVIVLFAPMESEGPNDLYGFRQEDNFYYLSGSTEPGAALLIAPAVEASKDNPGHSYTEILT